MLSEAGLDRHRLFADGSPCRLGEPTSDMGLNVRVPWPSGTRRRVIGDQLGVGTVNTPTVTINIPKAPSPDTSLCPRKSQQLWGTVRGKEVSVRRQDFSLTPAVVGNTGREEACDGFQLESQETCSRGSRPQCFRWPCILVPQFCRLSPQGHADRLLRACQK